MCSGGLQRLREPTLKTVTGPCEYRNAYDHGPSVNRKLDVHPINSESKFGNSSSSPPVTSRLIDKKVFELSDSSKFLSPITVTYRLRVSHIPC